MNHATSLARLAPYVPSAVLRKLARGGDGALAPVERVRGAVLLLDIAGFTPIVVTLSSLGPRGIDALQRLLTACYTEMIEVVQEWGGDVYQFAGDSILTLFETAPGEPDEQVVRRAVACGLGIQRRMARFSNIEVQGYRFSVSARIGLGHGDCHRLLLGSAEQWRHPALVGGPLERAVAAEKRATVGEVVAGPEVWSLLGGEWAGSEVREGFFRLESVREPRDWRPAHEQPRAPEEARLWAEACARLINPTLLKKVASEHQDFTADFRDITAFFLRFTLRESAAPPSTLADQLDRLYTLVQSEAATHGGVLLMTDFTDKGHVLYVLFGAPTAQPNKEVLACRLACRLLREKEALPFVDLMQVGIATGPGYCGDLGSPARKGYSTLGEAVNLAARLMTFGRDTAIYVDANTERRLQQGFITSLYENVTLKGVARPVPIYRIQSEARQVGSALVRSRGQIVGRQVELERLRQAVRASVEGAGQVCLVSGEAGIGKSRITSALVEEAEALGARTLYGVCYSYEMFTPFFPWKEVLVQLFGVVEGEAREAVLEKLYGGLETLEDGGFEWVAVLAGILGLQVEEDARTRAMDARRKNQRVFQIIFRLLERQSRLAPLLLVFEDLHWADKISLDLLEYVATRLEPLRVTLLANTRPGEALRGLLALPNFHLLELTSLGDEDTRALLRMHLRLEPPNLTLEELLLSKVQGNPFFIESIVQGLLEQGHLAMGADGRMTLQRSLQSLRLPDSIQDVVLSRIDRLPELEQMVVKVASVIGRVFTLEAVRALLPGSLQPERVRAALASLNGLGLTVLEVEEPPTCLFKHIVIRDVAYNTLLVGAREELHRKLARYLEARAGSSRAGSAGILAFHYLAGNDDLKGLEYTLLAARSAKAQYANADAVHHYNRALEVLSTTRALPEREHLPLIRRVMRELAETLLQEGSYQDALHMFEQCLAEDTSHEEQAMVRVGMGRAYQEKGESARAIAELERALRLMGRSAPRTLVGVVVRTAGRLVIFLLSQLFPAIWRPVPAEQRPTYLKQLSTLISLARIYYFVDLPKMAWATLVAYGMAERSRSDYGRSVASCYILTLYFGAGLLQRSEPFSQRALEYAQRAQDPVAEGVALSRTAIYFLFRNELPRSLELMQQSISTLQQVGERWEVQLCLMILATGRFLSSQFEEAERTYVRMGALGQELNALMHQGWAHAWAPLCRYLLGRGEVGALREEMERGWRISKEVNDLANQCAALNHLAIVAVREGGREEAAQAAVRAFDTVWRYQVLVPFLQVGLVDSAEAALYALEQGATSVPRRRLLRVARLASAKARLLGRIYPYLRGPALRVTARLRLLTSGQAEAEPLFLQAIACLEGTPNQWELGVACYDAAVALPHRRAQLLARAHQLFHAVGALAELRRVRLLEQSGPAPQPLPAHPPAAEARMALR